LATPHQRGGEYDEGADGASPLIEKILFFQGVVAQQVFAAFGLSFGVDNLV